MSFSITQETVTHVNLKIFNANLGFSLYGDEAKILKNISDKDIVPLLSRTIIDVQNEYRRDDKKVYLFYKNSEQASHLMSFVFAVEATEELTNLVKLFKDKKNPMEDIIKYLYENKDNLSHP